ncbi:hypothetical protein OH492_24915 [Vibrio chagasii]|nr:hypothetical protein [Vibrio chagasii]
MLTIPLVSLAVFIELRAPVFQSSLPKQDRLTDLFAERDHTIVLEYKQKYAENESIRLPESVVVAENSAVISEWMECERGLRHRLLHQVRPGEPYLNSQSVFGTFILPRQATAMTATILTVA